MSVGMNFTQNYNTQASTSAGSVNFKGKKDVPQDNITEAYKITNDVPPKEKIISGGDVAFPAVFALPYAYKRTDFNLKRLLKKADRLSQKTGNWGIRKWEKVSKKAVDAKKLIGDGKVHFDTVNLFKNPKAAFKEYGGKFMLIMNGVMEAIEVSKTKKELGNEAATKQAFRGIANTGLSATGWVAGSALGHKLAAKVGGWIGGAIGGPVGRFVGNIAGSMLGFMGGVIGERLLRKGGELVYGKSELAKAKENKTEVDLKNIALNDKDSLKNQIVKNQLWLATVIDANGQPVGLGKKKTMKNAETVAKANDELLQRFIAVGGTVEEIQKALENPEQVVAETALTNQPVPVNTLYTGGYNSTTGLPPNNPNFQSYPQRVFV